MTHRTSMDADDVLDILEHADDLLETQPRTQRPLLLTNPILPEAAPQENTCIIVHPVLGVFVSYYNNFVFWSNYSAGGFVNACLFSSPEDAIKAVKTHGLTGPENPEAIELFFTNKSDAETLQRMGLDVGDLAMAPYEHVYTNTLNSVH